MPEGHLLLDDPVGQMGDARSIHDAGKFEFDAPGLEPIDQASSASEQVRSWKCLLTRWSVRRALVAEW